MEKKIWIMDSLLPSGEWYLGKLVSCNEERFNRLVSKTVERGFKVRTHSELAEIDEKTCKILGRNEWRRKMHSVYRYSKPDVQHFWNAFAEYFTA